jgi:hypothetical protein
MLATTISIVSAVIAILSAISSARTSYQINGSGFKASQALLTDLVTLLSAIRSIAFKAAMVMGEGRKIPIPIETEIDTLRTFLTSTSGLALSMYAGKVGSAGAPNDPVAGAWRVLQMNLTRLAAMTLSTASDSQEAGGLALEIERTLSRLNAKSIKEMRHEIKNLPNVLSSMDNSRHDNILLRVLDELTQEQKAKENNEFYKRRLRQLKDSGITDPTLDLWLAMLEDDKQAGAEALANGADQSVSLQGILKKYTDKDSDKDSD